MSGSKQENAQPSYLDQQGKYKGLLGWIFSTDVVFGLLMRIELFFPGQDIMSPQTYNAMFTVHGVIMIFIIVIPGLSAVFGNFFLPILIGAKDVAFPRLNLLSWWIFLFGAILAVLSQFAGSGAPDTGWTFYVPYSAESDSKLLQFIECEHRECRGSECHCFRGRFMQQHGFRFWQLQ